MPAKTLVISLALCVLSLINQSAAYRIVAQQQEKVPIQFNHCSKELIVILTNSYHQLPQLLKSSIHQTIKVECSEKSYPFGFEVLVGHTDTLLNIGHLSRLAEDRSRRANYRLNHLSFTERENLWQLRGLVHAIVRTGSLLKNWHLDKRFKRINGWSDDGAYAQNQDHWGYARALGEQSALDDFTTSAEEWFIRATKRIDAPDNRVECQSFSKGRFFTQLFYPTRKDLPPPHCRQFWQWSNRYSWAELIYTAPTSSPISSFGHLALVLRSQPGPEPEYLDPVYQFVGLVSSINGRKSLVDNLLDDTPLILQADDYLSFDQQTRLREDRHLYHFRLKLSDHELTWLKARLWEQARRFQASYHFMTENCAEMLLRLFQGLTKHKLNVVGWSTSPLGVISVLRKAKLLSPDPSRRASLSEQLLLLEQVINRFRKDQKAINLKIPPLGDLTHRSLKRWQTFLKQLSSTELTLLPFLHHIQDYYDLAIWQLQRVPLRIAPIKSRELLELKNELLHEEQFAEEVATRMSTWYQQKYTLSSKKKVTQRENLEQLTDLLVEEISDTIQRLGAANTVQSPLDDSVSLWHPQMPSRSWGSDSSFLWRMKSDLTAFTSSGFNFTLYDERQGDHRSLLRSANRDLQWFKLSLSTERSTTERKRDYRALISPLSLHIRSGTLGVSWLGILLDTQFGFVNRQVFAFLQLGNSIQLASWWAGRGDLSMGLLLAYEQAFFEQVSVSMPYFITASLPLSHSILLKARASRYAWSTSFLTPSDGYHALIDFALPFFKERSLSLQVEYQLTYQNSKDLEQEVSLGFRMQ